MKRNILLYNASTLLVQCAKFVKYIDSDYSQELLNKAQEYKDQIKIDEELEKEVSQFEQEIRKGL